MNKEKFNIEYVFDNVSRSSLWNHITTPRGLSSWFAEKVTIKNNVYTFIWNKDELKARAELIKQKEQIRYCLETENAGPFSYFENILLLFWFRLFYFEFSIHTLELTGTTFLQITDFAEPDEKEDAIDLWDSQIDTLKRTLGI